MTKTQTKSRIASGEVEITLDGETRTLRPSLNAATKINHHFGGFAAALQSIAAMNLEAVTYVVRLGLGQSESEARGLREQVYRAGVLSLAGPVSLYVTGLSNGGRLPDEETGEDEGGPEGNG